MSIHAFHAHTLNRSPYHRFNSHMRQDMLGRDAQEAEEDMPPDPFTPARLPLWGLDEW